MSFDPFRRTVARVAVDPLSLEGDWTFLLSSFIVASTRLLLFIVLLSLLSVLPVRSGSMFSFEGDLGNGLFGEPFAFADVTGALLRGVGVVADVVVVIFFVPDKHFLSSALAD